MLKKEIEICGKKVPFLGYHSEIIPSEIQT